MPAAAELAISPCNSQNGKARTFSRRLPPRIRICCASSESTKRSTTRKDRKSTRLNSSHSQISYAVFCLKKKKVCADLLAPTEAVDCLPNEFLQFRPESHTRA